MYGFSIGHVVIVGIVVLLFGSRKLPELGASLGKGMRAFKDGMEGRTVNSDTELLDSELNKKTSNSSLIEERQKK
ncbi:MAG: twin-arginine translocase TatA/TatE family subunit [Oligoflexia bacterium]|nr:twin-arginine translocase TatA/TatE family subunit [Oligoflexia bacterium]